MSSPMRETFPFRPPFPECSADCFMTAFSWRRTSRAEMWTHGMFQESCWTISDKALAIGGGVLEAVLMAISGKNTKFKSQKSE
jgi:hypothetical protein